MLSGIPSDPRLTVALVILWLGLAVYIVVHGDPLGYAILGIVGVFIALPALIVFVERRRRR